MSFWLRAYSHRSWQKFRATGSQEVAFRGAQWGRAKQVQVGDVLLCYAFRLNRWVGVLEVARVFAHERSDLEFPSTYPMRGSVKTIVSLDPEFGVPMDALRGKLSFYASDSQEGGWLAHVRRSPTPLYEPDGLSIQNALLQAAKNPISRPFESVARGTRPTDPEGDSANASVIKTARLGETDLETGGGRLARQGHTEIQWRILDFGGRMGMDVWAPKSDRVKLSSKKGYADIPALLDVMPSLFNVPPNLRQAIENIDCLWLKDEAIVAAFEVEHTTAIYSGLLRLSDLITMSPMIRIELYLVAPDDRYAKFVREISRPTFSNRDPPLHTVCRFLPYSDLCRRIEETRNVLRFVRSGLLGDIARAYDPLGRKTP